MLLIIQIHHPNEEHGELFDKITNKLTSLEKLVKIVSNATEKKRINNTIRGIEFTLDYDAFLKDANDSESDSSNFD